MKIFHTFVILILLSGLIGCGARVPSNAKTAQITQKYFKKYGKKYSESVFGSTSINNVQVDGVMELQKDYAEGYVVLMMEDGQNIPVILTMLRKFPRGWRVNGWENAGQSL